MITMSPIQKAQKLSVLPKGALTLCDRADRVQSPTPGFDSPLEDKGKPQEMSHFKDIFVKKMIIT